MARDTALGAKDLWVYFAVTIPVLASAFLIARPPNGGILWIADYLRGPTRKPELKGWDTLDMQSLGICRLLEMHCGAPVAGN